MKPRKVKKKEAKTGTKKVVLIVAVATLLVIVLLSVTFVSTGEAFLYKFKAKLTLPGPVYIKEGCYIKINNDAAYWLTSSKEECKSLFIASSYVGRKDFYRLLYSLKYPSAPVSKTGLNLVNTGGAEKVTLTNTSNNFTILYYKGDSFDYFESVKPSSSASSCQELGFFGVKLYCFNEVAGKKENNLPQIITYFTVLKYTSNQKVMNGLVGKEVYPINFIADNSIKYYDASAPELYGETLETVKCGESNSACGKSYGSANYNTQQKRVYICAVFLNSTLAETEKKLAQAAKLYHEANHKYDSHRCWHQEDFQCEPQAITSDCTCSQPPEKPPQGLQHSRDWDFNSVYGTHINYLLSMSQNEILPCGWRIFAFEEAEKELKTKLCQKPNQPKIGNTKPVCD